MSGLDDLVVKWWAGLNDDQRSRVKQAAERESHPGGSFSRADCHVNRRLTAQAVTYLAVGTMR